MATFSRQLVEAGVEAGRFALILFIRHGCRRLGRAGQHGLVERRPHPTDRRTTLACITELGRQRAAAATEVMNDLFVTIGLDAEQLASLVSLLTVVRASAGGFV